MKKIGILTFHCAHNYGAVLQTYALQEFLKKHDYNTSVIDYRPSYILHQKKVYDLGRGFKNRSFLGKIRQLIILPLLYRKRCKRFDAFENFINTKLNLINIDRADHNQCDAVIVGSDQVWNLDLTGGADKYYGAYPETVASKKKISYAASLGTCKFTDRVCDIFKEYLMNFDVISVREKTSAKILSQFTNKPVSTVLDPVFFMDDHIMEKIILSQPKEKYVLVYEIHKDSNVLRIAKQIAKQLNCKIVRLAPSATLSINQNIYDCASVEEFLTFFKYAEFIVTTSFHGTAFSIINRKNFYTVKLGNSIDNRSMDLLSELGMEDRAIDKEGNYQFSDISYVDPNLKLINLQDLSKSFLLDNLK